MEKNIAKDIEKRIRYSIPYRDWTIRNKATTCLLCGATEYLECHHLVPLITTISKTWEVYRDEEELYEHLIAEHKNDRCDNVTLCNNCHEKKHFIKPKKHIKLITPPSSKKRIYDWCAIPRNIDIHLFQSKVNKQQGHLGLIGFQTLLGIGWYVINGYLDSRMITFNRRLFAKLLKKTPSSSFNKSLSEALLDLETIGVLNASVCLNNEVELHLSEDYLQTMSDNPWFVDLNDVLTSKSCVLNLKWFLGLQSDKKKYKISLKKLMGHIGIQTTSPRMAFRAIRKACKDIKWAKVGMSEGICTFKLKGDRSTPIFSLRDVLSDAIAKGM